ncbi:MAG: Rne/Rng family ribonuclease [Mariprofundales bacterium]
MPTELLINVSPYESRIARVEEGRVEELYIEREQERGLRGNIYKGRVQRVLPGIQAAFVNIGLERAGFLHVSDVACISKTEPIKTPQENKNCKLTWPDIHDLLSEDQEIIVQVSREPIASKGPRLTCMLSLAGRYFVLLPYDLNHIGIAHRIEGTEERQRLLESAEALKPDNGGLVVRTAAEGKHLFELQADVQFLQKMWQEISLRISCSSPCSLIHKELNIYLRVIRDFVDDSVESIHIDSKQAYDSIKLFTRRFMPEVKKCLHHYEGNKPLFSRYHIEEEITLALNKSVRLKSGGYLVIEQTEALVAIDVNSGSFVKSSSLEETSFKTNLEAANEIVHQLRLRNLGGIIVVDFIDMQEQKSRDTLMEVLREALQRDKAKVCVVRLSELGLVEMTRKRTRESLGRTLLHHCPHCKGRGRTRSIVTICYDIFRELLDESRTYPCDELVIIAHPSVIERLLGEEAKYLSALEQFIDKPIYLKKEVHLHPEQFEINMC